MLLPHKDQAGAGGPPPTHTHPKVLCREENGTGSAVISIIHYLIPLNAATHSHEFIFPVSVFLISAKPKGFCNPFFLLLPSHPALISSCLSYWYLGGGVLTVKKGTSPPPVFPPQGNNPVRWVGWVEREGLAPKSPQSAFVSKVGTRIHCLPVSGQGIEPGAFSANTVITAQERLKFPSSF